MTGEEGALLFREARAGSAEALSAIYQRVAPRLLALIRLRMGRSLRARLESRDILQATLLKSFQRLDQFEGRDGASILSWLSRIAENEIRDQADFQHRQRRDADRAVPLDASHDQVAASVRSALSQVLLGEQADRLEKALEELDPDYRDVIILRKLEELSFRDVAARMVRSEDACRMLLARAMTQLTLKLRDAS